jgi:hypothetical protein
MAAVANHDQQVFGGRGRTCTGIEEHLDQMHCDLCLMVDSDNPMTNPIVSRDSSVRNKLNLHHAARSAAAAALPFDKPFCCHLPPPHISIASQPHSLCLLLFTSLTIPFLHLSKPSTSLKYPINTFTSPCSAGRIVHHPRCIAIAVETTVCLSRKHRKIGPGLCGYGTYARRILTSRPRYIPDSAALLARSVNTPHRSRFTC